MKSELSFVYMIRCAGGQLYTGWTNDPAARLAAHKKGVGAKYTRGFAARALAYLEQCPDKSSGLRREAALKKCTKAEKEALCAAWAADMQPRLSVATVADAAEILEIYNWYVAHSNATFQVTPAAPAEYEAWVRDTLAVAPLLLARTGSGRLMGYACAHRWHEREAFAWDRELTVYCAPWARGLGVGRALYTPLLELLRRQGIWNAYALIADPNPASEAMHAALGFVCEGRTPRTGYKLGAWQGLSTWHLALRRGRGAPGPLRVLPPEEVAAVLAQAAP